MRLQGATECVRASTVKNLVSPQHDQHFISTRIGDVMRPPRNCIHDLGFIPRSCQLVCFPRQHMTKTKKPLPLDNQELLSLAMVVVSATGLAGVG